MSGWGVVFLDVRQCGSYKSRRFGGRYHFHHQGVVVLLRSGRLLIVTANVVLSSPILFTLMTEELRPIGHVRRD
jgi:hypothetical protein